MINNIIGANFLPLLKDINHPELLQEWKLNLDAAAYKKILMLTCLNIMIKKKFIVMIAVFTGQPQ